MGFLGGIFSGARSASAYIDLINQHAAQQQKKLGQSLHRISTGRVSDKDKNPEADNQSGNRTAAVRGKDTVEISPAAREMLSVSNGTTAPPSESQQQQSPQDFTHFARLAGQAIALQAILGRMGGGIGGSSGNGTVEASAPETVVVQEPVVEQDLASTVNLGVTDITNINEVAFDEETGQVTEATGSIDLSAYGLGSIQVDLTMENGEIVGATSTEDSLHFGTGDLDLAIGNTEGDLLTIDSSGGIVIDGDLTLNLGDDVSLNLGEADVSLQADGLKLTAGAAEGGAGLSITVSGDEVSIDASRDITGTIIGGLAGASMGDAFNTVTSFMSAAGLSGDTGGSDFNLTVSGDSFSFEAFGISGSYGTNADGDKEISVGGFSFGAGISLSVENVTVDESGDLSAEIAAGVGASIGSVGVGFDLAGFEVGYASDTGDISLTGTVGNDFMNIEATVSLTRDNNGAYSIGSIDFAANFDDNAARQVAAGLTSAYAQGTELGANAFNQVSGMQRDVAAKFGRELQNAGADMQAFLNETSSVVTQYGAAKLGEALDYGRGGVTAMARHGEQLFDAAAELGGNAQGAMNDLAGAAAGRGQQSLENFINNNIVSDMGELTLDGGRYIWKETREVSDWLNPFRLVKSLQDSFRNLSDI